MRFSILILAVWGLAAAPLQAQEPTNRFDRPARVREYGASLFDVYSWASVAGSTLLDQIRDHPETWTFGDRALSNSGRFVIEESIYHGVAAMQDRSTWYYPCQCTGVPNRVAHAFAEAITDHDRTGATHISVARLGASYGAATVEALWHPEVSIGDAVTTATTSLVFSGLFNIMREFARPNEAPAATASANPKH
jgi:hypothetical protein